VTLLREEFALTLFPIAMLNYRRRWLLVTIGVCFLAVLSLVCSTVNASDISNGSIRLSVGRWCLSVDVRPLGPLLYVVVQVYPPPV